MIGRLDPRLRRAAAGFFLLNLLFLSVFTAPGATARQTDLYDLYDIKALGTEVIVVVDTSKSMRDKFSEVRSALGEFVGGLGSRDRLTIVTFADKARVAYTGPARGAASFPKKISPSGDKTDIGVAVTLVLERLREVGDDRVPVVLFMTDGLEDPPKESRFAAAHDQAWRRAAARAGKERQANQAFVYGIGLNRSTDINLIKQVWPKAEPLAVEPKDLSTYLSRLKQRIRQDKLRFELGRDLRGGRVVVKAQPADWGSLESGAEMDRSFTVTSTFKHLPIEVEVTGVDWRGFQAGSGRGAKTTPPELAFERQEFLLRPGESRQVPVKVRAPSYKSRFGAKEEASYAGRLRIEAAGRPAFAGEIAALGLDPRAKTEGTRPLVRFDRTTGQAWYLLGFLALALAAAATVFGRYLVIPGGAVIYRSLFAPPLFGRLAFSRGPADAPLPRPISLETYGKRAVIGRAGDIGLEGEDIMAKHAELFSRWDEGEPRLWVDSKEGAVKVAAGARSAAVAISGPTPLSPGSVIEIGRYKMQWT